MASPCTRGAEVMASRPASKGARSNKPCPSLIVICRHERRLPGLKAALIKACQVVANAVRNGQTVHLARCQTSQTCIHSISQRRRRVALLLYVVRWYHRSNEHAKHEQTPSYTSESLKFSIKG